MKWNGGRILAEWHRFPVFFRPHSEESSARNKNTHTRTMIHIFEIAKLHIHLLQYGPQRTEQRARGEQSSLLGSVRFGCPITIVYIFRRICHFTANDLQWYSIRMKYVRINSHFVENGKAHGPPTYATLVFYARPPPFAAITHTHTHSPREGSCFIIVANKSNT